MSANTATQPAVLPKENKVDPKQRKPSKSTGTNSQPSATTQVIQPNIEDHIRDRAYQLYVERGSRDGHALQDWFDAEFELLANR